MSAEIKHVAAVFGADQVGITRLDRRWLYSHKYSAQTQDEIKGFSLGAVDYITKPIKVEIVLARLNTHLTLRKIQHDLAQKNLELQEALDAIKTLKRMPAESAEPGLKDYQGHGAVLVYQSELSVQGLCHVETHQLQPNVLVLSGQHRC